MSSHRSSIPRILGIRLALLVLGVAAGLALAEAIVRFVAPQPGSRVTPGLYASAGEDPLPRYRLRPGHEGEITNFVEFAHRVEVTPEGLRAPALTAEPDAPRVLTVGDSFPFGWGVEGPDAFPVLLARGLVLEDGPAVGLNGGVPGYGVPDAVAWLERYGRDLAPDVVVLAVFPGNDPIDATDKHGRVDLRDGLVTGFGGTSGWKDRLHAHSHLFRLGKAALGGPVRSLLGRPPSWQQVYLRDVVECYAREPGALVREGRSRTRESARRFVEVVQELGARSLVVLVPGPLGADPERFTVALETFGLARGAYSQDAAAAWFAALFATELGLDVLDLGPDFRAGVAAGETLFYRHDPHWTVAGHALGAGRIRERLALRAREAAGKAPATSASVDAGRDG